MVFNKSYIEVLSNTQCEHAGNHAHTNIPFQCTQKEREKEWLSKTEIKRLVQPGVPSPYSAELGNRFSEMVHQYAACPSWCNMKFYQFSFFTCIVILWNSLPLSVFLLNTVLSNVFNSRANKILLHNNHQLLTN